MKLIFCLDPLRVSITGIGRYTYELAKGFQDCAQLESLKFQYLLGWVDDPQVLINKYHSAEQVRSKGNHPSWFKKSLHHVLRAGYRAISPQAKGLITLPYKDHIYHSPNYEIPHLLKHSFGTSIYREPVMNYGNAQRGEIRQLSLQRGEVYCENEFALEYIKF